MRVCIPVEIFEGMESKVYGHFGSAPVFAIFNTDTNGLSTISNKDMHHAHGACNPVMALGGQIADAVIAGGIGAGALSKLNQAGIRVYRAGAENIKDNVDMLLAQRLPEFKISQTCGGHSHGGGCAH